MNFLNKKNNIIKKLREERLPIKQIVLIGLLPSRIKVILYKLKGYKIGKNVKFGFFSVIIGEEVNIGEKSEIGHFTVIKGKKISIGSFTEIDSLVFINVPKVEIGNDVIIREQVKIGGNLTYKSSFHIGDRSHIRQNVYINTSDEVCIGEETAIGGGSYIFTHSSWHSFLEGFPCTYMPVKIGNNVWISWNSFILPNVTIHNDVLIGAGSVVTKTIPENCIAMGNPAKVVIPSGHYKRELDFEDKIHFLDEIFINFIEYLDLFNIEGEIQKNKDYWVIKLRYETMTIKFLLLFSNIESLTKQYNNIIFLLRKREKDFKIDYNQKCIIDLNFYEKFGQNDECEILSDFFLKYGIKLKRRK